MIFAAQLFNRGFAPQKASKMAVKLRLQRHGKKGRPFFHIVAADERAKRDGKFIEKVGTYNPNTNPATIDLNFDRALYWVQTGAVPTDTCRAILSYKGILLKDHLDRGVKKGALTQEQADAKFAKWVEEKENKVLGKVEALAKVEADKKAATLKAEAEVNEKRAADIAAKQAEEAAAEAGEEETAEGEAEASEETSEEAAE